MTCEHCKTEMVFVSYLKSNKAKCFSMQCMSCGFTTGNDFGSSGIPPGTKILEINEELRESFRKKQREEYDKKRASQINEYLEKKEKDREEWFNLYNKYLDSQEWKNTRQKSLEHYNHICQGCFTETATEVHHLSYNHVGNELMFELVPLCFSCHVKAHEKNTIHDLYKYSEDYQ